MKMDITRTACLLVFAASLWFAGTAAGVAQPAPPVTTNHHNSAPDDGEGSAETAYQRGRDAVIAGEENLAIELFDTSCRLGNSKSCFNVGLLTENQLREVINRPNTDAGNWAKDIGRIAGAFSKSCDLGFGRGCAMLIQYYRSPKYDMQDLPKAISLAQRACDGGEISGCEDLAEIYYLGEGVAADLPRAASLFKRGCDADGRALSCFNYALMNDKGQGGERNPAAALDYYRIGCRRGSDTACINLAGIYADNKDDLQGQEVSIGLYRKSCGNGSLLACNNLAVQLQEFSPTDEGKVEAANAYRKACEGGEGRACRGLGNLIHDGVAAAGRKREATKYFVRGCELGSGISCYNAGLMYFIGYNAPERPRTALAWFSKGCTLGSSASCSGAALVASGLKPDDPFGGMEMAKQWLDYARYLDPEDALLKSLEGWLDNGAVAADAPTLETGIGGALR